MAICRARTSILDPDSDIILAAEITSVVCFSGPLPLKVKECMFVAVVHAKTQIHTQICTLKCNPLAFHSSILNRPWLDSSRIFFFFLMRTYCVKTQDILPRRRTPFDLQSHELLTINLSLEILFVNANPIRQRYFPYSRRKHEILNNLYVWQYILISRYAFNLPLFNPFLWSFG